MLEHNPTLGLNAPSAEEPKRHLTATQRDQIARLLVLGMHPASIAPAYNVSPDTITRLDLHDSDMAARKQDVACLITKTLVLGKFGFFEGLDEAIDIAKRVGLRSQDPKVQLDTAKWWISRTLPEPKSTTVHEHTGGLDVRLPEGLTDSISKMTTTLDSLKLVAATLPDANTYIRTELPKVQTMAPTATPNPNGNGSDPHND